MAKKKHNRSHAVPARTEVPTTVTSELPLAPTKRRKRRGMLYKLIIGFVVVEAAILLWMRPGASGPSPELLATPSPTPTPQVKLKAGSVIGQDSTVHFDAAQTQRIINQNYPGYPNPSGSGVTKIIFHYRSTLPDGQPITVYGRAYLPDAPKKKLPIFAFAPGTTGIDDKCAASLERPAVSNWANYDSHMTTYAAHGYASVITDYEGMRDPKRLHHYMVGELEGRAVLDSVRALRELPQARGRLADAVYFGGYSQGGHAAYWADKIAPTYASDVKPLGVVGFGPVMSVKQTLTDIARGANINWFGPNVLLSYRSYYGGSYPNVVLPAREPNLGAEVLAHCIDTDLSYWGHVPANIYTPEFIQAALSDQMSTFFPEFTAALEANTVGLDPTPSAKRINQGARDNVVLPAQQIPAAAMLCQSSSGPVQHIVYPNATHYDTMLQSFNDTLAWMKALQNGEAVTSTCPSS